MTLMPNEGVAALIYQPLNESPSDHNLQEIRLMTVNHLGGEGSLVACTLRKVTLGASRNSYCALSYVWGDAKDTEAILVNGERFQATKNLVQALHHACVVEPRARAALWVDAICINQTDIPERNIQVSVMGSLYRGAGDVLCWLGAGDAVSAAAMQLVNHLTYALQSVPDTFNPEYSPFGDPVFGELVSAMEGHGLLNVPMFYSVPYWERAWTTQEMALARSCILIAGTSTCLLGHVDAITGWARDFVAHMDASGHDPVGVTPSIGTFMRNISRFSEQGLPIVTAMALWKLNAAQLQRLHGSDHDLTMSNLALTNRRNATDPRDKIYSLAMLGPIGINIDYSSPVQDVYTRFAAQIITKLSDICPLLEGAGVINRESKLNIPIWATDWSVPITARQRYGSILRNNASINKHLPASSRAVRTSGSELHLIGTEIDRIQDAMPIPRLLSHEDELDHIAKVACFLYQCDSRTVLEQIVTEPSKSRRYPTGIPMLTAVLRLLQAQGRAQNEQWEPDALRVLVPFIRCMASSAELNGQLPVSWDNSSFVVTDDHPGYRVAEGGESGSVVLSRICDPARSEMLDTDTILREAYRLSDDDLFRDFMWATPFSGKMSPFLTSSGYVGYTRDGVRRGDVIYAVGACSMPIILRPAGDCYEFLSTCCVIGIMDGHMIGGQDELSLQDIVVK